MATWLLAQHFVASLTIAPGTSHLEGNSTLTHSIIPQPTLFGKSKGYLGVFNMNWPFKSITEEYKETELTNSLSFLQF